MACPYCFGEADTQPSIQRPVFIQAVAFAQSVGASAIEFCGGEPLLYKDLEWAVTHTRSRGFKLILRTNGYFVPRHFDLIVDNFDAVGVSLDGDASGNARMRPVKGNRLTDINASFEAIINAIRSLKDERPDLYLVVASVVTAENVDDVVRLASLLVDREVPLDIWKVYQFVSNNFRSLLNRDRLHVRAADFSEVEARIREAVGGAFDVVCRPSEETDGSCIVVNRDGVVMSGVHRLGNVVDGHFEEIRQRIVDGRIGAAVRKNKVGTYGAVLSSGSPQ